MTSEPRGAGDPYSRTEYRRLIAWERRIEREGPFLAGLLAEAPDRSVLDLGCGTGEHVAWFATEGARTVGLDRSESMIEAAREHEAKGAGRFVLGDALEADRLLADEAPFGMAICLGNMLPHLQGEGELDRFLAAAHGVLAEDGLLLVQLLNYRRIVEQGIRHLPVNVRDGDEGREIVFLRLMQPRPDGRMLFFPTTLELDPESEEPIRLKTTRRVELRAWTADDLVTRGERAGFRIALHGDMLGGAFDPLGSQDLVVVATRA